MLSKLKNFYSPTVLVGLLSFWIGIFLFPNATQANTCPTKRIDKYASVKRVYDGDTIQLSTGEKIRLIGVNAPEMHYETGTPEPYAKQATFFLRKKLLGKRIGLRYGQSNKDHYKRSLAHVFLKDGSNIQAELLRNGYAFNIAIPPDLWQQSCYQALENEARNNHLGIWNIKRYQPMTVEKLNKTQLGFLRVKGTIRRVKETKKSYWLDLTENMALRIDKRDKSYFRHFPSKQWQGRHVIVKGWVNYHDKSFYMRIKHPAAMEFY